ncbi:pericentrin isoform X2 [Rana temporaria]|uniref:pericentrin isoform X2 n=1 Tax=Rana temporaria TaxID=8407 RepID=UPI001AAD0FF7|nr:pericentrin isoform X2 [Rana temporaria]
MDGTAEEQRTRKVQAGRDKLARFRQHKAKGQSTKTQKKTQKRKGEVVRKNDIPSEEGTLIPAECTDNDPVLGAEQVSTEISLDHSSLDVSECLDKMSDLEYRLQEKWEDGDIGVEDISQLQTTVADDSSELHEQDLQSAVHERDAIITRLSSNLQKALLDQKEMEDEASCLSSQIQAIQLQLQDASMVLKNESLGKKALHQAQQQFAFIHSELMDQTVKKAQDLERKLETSQKSTKEKDNQVAKLENLLHEQQTKLEILQEKLDLSESSVTHLQQELSERNQVIDLKSRISMPIQPDFTPSCSGDDQRDGKMQRSFISGQDSVESLSLLVIDVKQRLAESECVRESLVKKIEKQMKDFETERISWEQRYNDEVSSLKEKLQQAEQTATHDKADKDRFNKEINDLKESLRLEAEGSKALKLQHERDLQIYMLKLESMKETKEMLCEKLLGNKKEGSDMDEEKRCLLNDLKDEHFRHELEDIKKNLSRVKARKEYENTSQLHKEEYDETFHYNEGLTLMDKYLIPSQLEVSYGHEDVGDHSRFELDSDFMLEQSIGSTMEGNLPLLCSPMPITGVLSGAASLGTILDPESFAIYLSQNVGSSDKKCEYSSDFAENAFQKCSVLMVQLKDKEKQLQICSESLEEAITKWRDLTAELAATQLELDREKTINRNLEEQQRLIEDLKKERDEFKLSTLGQHLKETDNQQLAKDEQLSQLADKNVFLENRLSLVERELEKAIALNKSLQISNVNLAENLHDSEKVRESEHQDFDNKLNSKGLEQQLLQEAIKAKEEEFFRKEESLREEVHLLKQVNEGLQSRLQEQLVHNVDLEALRLSLNNMHTAQLELSQTNLLKEKECALVQLRETLNEKRAQGVAFLQSHHQFELQRLQDEHNQELKNLKDKLSQEEHSLAIEQLRDENAKEALVLQQKNSLEMERLQDLHGKEKEEWKRQHDHLLQDMKQLQDKLAQKTAHLEVHSKDIDLLKEQHAKEVLELQELNIKDKKDLQDHYVQQENEWEAQQEKHFNEIKLLREDQKELQSKIIDQIKLEFSEEIKRLQELHNTEKDTLEKLHAEEILEWESQKSYYCEELERRQGEREEPFKNLNLEHIDLLKEQHAVEVMQLEQHNQETEKIKEDYAKEKWKKQIDQHSQELKQLKEEFSQKTLQQNALHKEEIEQLEQKHSAEILQVQDLHKREKEQLLNTPLQEKQLWDERQEEFSKEILQLKEKYKEMEALHNLLVHEKEDWNKDRAHQSEVIKQLQDEISLKISQLQKQHSEAIEHLQEQYENAMKEAKDRHHREKEEWEKERDQCSQELDLLVNQHSLELKRIGEELLQVSLQKAEQHSKMLEQLQEEFSKTVLDIQNQHSREMQKVVELHAKERAQWESMHIQSFQKTQDMPLKCETTVDPELVPELDLQDLRKLKEQHDMEVKELLNYYKIEKMEWENKLVNLSKQMNHLVTCSFQEIKKYLDEHSEENEGHSAKILELQEHYRNEMETIQERYALKNVDLKDKCQASAELHQPQISTFLNQDESLGQQMHSQVASMHTIQSSQEIQLLLCQIDSSRASRQELNELKDHLIARSMHLEEIERMKQGFHKEQQRLNAAHEKDVEDLRIYFEQKSRAAEETYRENLELLHQRLREMSFEGREEMSTLNSSVLTLDESFDNEKTDLLLHLTDQLVQHKEELSSVRQQSLDKHTQEIENLHAALSRQYQEDLLNMKMELSDKYTYEFENLKRMHSSEMEQLKARLSEEHIKELTRLNLESSGQDGCPKRTQPLEKLEEPQDPKVKIEELSNSARDVGLKQLGKSSEDESRASFGDVVEKKHVGCVQNLQEQKAPGPESIKDHMASPLEELVKRLYAEKTQIFKAMKEAQNRTKQFHGEKTTLQESLLREQQTSLVSKDKPSELISILSTQKEGLNSRIFEENHRWEPGTCVSELRENRSKLPQNLDGELYFQSFDLECCQEPDLLSCLSELLQRHQEEHKSCDLEHEAHIQSLEASHLIKLDTLESSYLTEIQKIRDEHTLSLEELEMCFSDQIQEKEKEIEERLEKARKLWLQQQDQELQHLRQELASVHLEKFQAMAKELEVAHQDALKEKFDQQRLQLDYSKSQALDALKEEVFRMEDHNNLALQELSNLHKMEVQQQTQTLRDELMKLTDERQKQELVVTELNNQLQVLSTELQNKSNRLLQLQEEIELLKCQSEMLLEQQITQLKEEFMTERKSAMQGIEEQFTRDSEKVHDEFNKEKGVLMGKLEENNGLVLQLQEKVSFLTNEMDGLQSQMETIVETRERENQEGKNLETILQTEVKMARQEWEKLQDSCQRLLKIFTDVLKNTLVTEDLIFKKIGLCLDSTLSQMGGDRNGDALTKSTVNEKNRLSPDCDTMTEQSLMSTDEGYEVSEYLCDSVLGSLEVGLENEEKIIQMSQRLRSAVERLLDMVSNSAVEIEQTHEIQKSFEEEFKSRNQEIAQVVVKNQDLVKLLAQETEAKNHLQVELHKAQGLVEGYAAEKAALEETLSLKETSEHQLVLELEKSQEKLKVLTQEPSALREEKELLLRLQEVLSSSEKDVKIELLKETQRLVKEKLELHCQADKDRSNLLSHMRVLEMELEDQMARNQELLKKSSEMTDFEQQIQALEKQLKHQRQFMDEQAVEREHERDDFQQEIRNLEAQLKQSLKNHGDSRTYRLHDWSEQNETLDTNAKEKADLNLLIEEKGHLEQQIAERNDEIDKMMLRIQELEQAALSNADAAKKCSQLEAELQNIHRAQNELLQDKEALQQQQYNNVLQISALQSKLDETRHRLPVEGDPDGLLKKELQAEREALYMKEKEAESLAEQLELFKEELTNKTEEVLQLNMQLEIQRKQSEQAVQQAQEEYLLLKEDVSSLHLDRTHDKPSPSLELLQALLQEKNQEIDHLNEQLLGLQEETSEVEELRSLVEHLRSDQERLQKTKEEEIEQLHEVIEKLQQELEQLGPIRHEVSDSQESLDQLGLGGADNLQAELRKGVKLERAHVAKESMEETEYLCMAELEALQRQLEEKEVVHVAEIEVLVTNLQDLQQSSRQNEQALDFVRMEHRNLQEESELLRTHVSQREEAVSLLTVQLQKLQDAVREKDTILMEKEIEVQTLQEHSMGDMSELRNQLAQSLQSLEATKIDLQNVQEQNASLQTTLSQSSKEQSEREKKHKEELEELKQCLKEWKDKSQKLVEEVQTQTDDIQNMTSLEVQSQLAVLNGQVKAAERLASEEEAKLRSTENEFTALSNVVDELRTECESWKAETQRVQQQLKKKEACVSELHSHSQNLGAQVKKLQEALASQEAMINVISMDLKKHEDTVDKPNGSARSGMKQRSFSESFTDSSAWDSPDMIRKQEDQVQSLRGLASVSELSINHSAELDAMKSKSFGCVKQLEQYNLLGSSTPSLSDSVYSLQHSIDTQKTSPVRETGHSLTDYDSCDDRQSSTDDRVETEQSDEFDYKLEAGKFQLEEVENLFGIKQKMDSMSGSGLSAQLQKMLSMVHEESCKILELSELPVAKVPSPESTELQIQRDAWVKERENLQDTIQSLSSALAQAAGEGNKESSTSDWRRDLLQSVQALLESERAYLRLELHSQLHHGTEDNSSLLEKVEHLIKEQEEQKRLVLEHVLAMDRNSLLSEIQDLRSQLRLAHLQNQEKLQQLQDALITAEEKGHTKEHQLRKQVELYEYKLQQEAAIAEDLKGSLLREQERSTEQHKRLLQEQSTVSQLHSEVEELQLELEKLKRQQKEMQIEATKLRNELESKEEAMSVLMQTVQTQREVESQRFEEENIIQQKLAHREKSLQESFLSLEEQKKLNAKISAALFQEQTCSSNLRKELEIEQSRCKALLAQEHKKLSEMQTELQKEKQYSFSLSSALTLERNVVEQFRQQQSQELCRQEEERHQERKIVVTLQNQLEEERRSSRDLAAMMEKTQKQAVDAKRQLEYEVQACREEMLKEREAAVKLRALLEALQSQKQQLDSVMEQQKEREFCLQKERDRYQAQLLTFQEEERVWAKEREKEMTRSKQTEVTRAREGEQERQIMDLQLQHERDKRRIQELQHMLADLEEQERVLASRKSQTWTDTASPNKSMGSLTSQMQTVWQQLFYTVLQVKKWVQNKNDSAQQRFPNEAEVTALLDSLADLKLQLQRGNLQTSVPSPSVVVDALRRENEELATTVSHLTKEKLELRSQLTKLSRSSQDPSYKENKEQLHLDSVESVLEAERAVWNREKRLLQTALKHAESELGKATLENRPVSEVSNPKVQRLYRKYLRAESFRKALVYQKKYLLLLLGGFQACEKATLSLIARMGVYPTPSDLQYPAKCKPGLTKFRSAVRAVIAISRLKFLVRKWSKNSRKGVAVEPVVQQVQMNRTEVLQHLSGTILNSPPTRDVTYGHHHSFSLNATPSPKPLPWMSRRVGRSPAPTPERSQYTSQDPEHSITDYIHHLELVQRRLGGLQNGASPDLHHVKYARK